MYLQIRLLTILAALTLCTSACKKDEASSAPAKDEAAAEEAPPTANAASVPAPDQAVDKAVVASEDNFLASLMQPYEECRAQLAADNSEPIALCAAAIAKASRAATAKAPESTHAQLEALALAADALATEELGEIEAVRLQFGKVSEATLSLLAAAPELGKDYHIFECPMAKGFKRWAQPNAALENPYMGAKMLGCGSEVAAAHE